MPATVSPLPNEAFPALNNPPPFVAPPKFSERNAELVRSIKAAMNHDDAKFSSFKTLSMQFRANSITAKEYYDAFYSLCGKDAQRIFPELVDLLPDSKKQQELLQVCVMPIISLRHVSNFLLSPRRLVCLSFPIPRLIFF